MSADLIDLARRSERLVTVRRSYGENIDLPNLEPNLFALLLGASAGTYELYERGESRPTVEFLVAPRNRTGVSLDWLLESNQPGPSRSFR